MPFFLKTFNSNMYKLSINMYELTPSSTISIQRYKEYIWFELSFEEAKNSWHEPRASYSTAIGVLDRSKLL